MVLFAMLGSAWTSTYAMAMVASPKTLDRQDFVYVHMPSKITFYYRVGTSIKGVTLPVDIHPSFVELPIGNGIVFSIDQLYPTQEYDGLFSVASSDSQQRSENLAPTDEAQYKDEWAPANMAIDSIVYKDTNTTKTYVALSNKTIDVDDFTSAYKYIIVLENAETNNTGSNSYVYAHFTNSSGTVNESTIAILSFNLRDEHNLWNFINFTASGLTGTVTCDYIKIYNINFEHVKIYKLETQYGFFDHRHVQMKINGRNFTTLAHQAHVKEIRMALWDPVGYLYDYPSFSATDTDEYMTGVYGWPSLDDMIDNLAGELFGDDYITYSLEDYELAFEVGNDLANDIYDTLSDAEEDNLDYAAAIEDVISDDVGAVTLGIDVGSAFLDDSITSAQDTVVDITNGIIASVWDNLGEGAEVVIDNVDGLTKTVTDATVGVVTQFEDGAVAVATGLSNWWNQNWGWIALIVGMLIVIGIILVAAFLYLKTGGSMPAFGVR